MAPLWTQIGMLVLSLVVSTIVTVHIVTSMVAMLSDISTMLG